MRASLTNFPSTGPPWDASDKECQESLESSFEISTHVHEHRETGVESGLACMGREGRVVVRIGAFVCLATKVDHPD